MKNNNLNIKTELQDDINSEKKLDYIDLEKDKQTDKNKNCNSKSKLPNMNENEKNENIILEDISKNEEEKINNKENVLNK